MICLESHFLNISPKTFSTPQAEYDSHIGTMGITDSFCACVFFFPVP